MAGQKIQIRRGVDSKIEGRLNLDIGELGLATDKFGKVYVGTSSGNLLVNEREFLKIGGGTLTGPLTLKGSPTVDLHAATKAYVDNIAQGLEPQAAVKIAYTENLEIEFDSQDTDLAKTTALGVKVLDGYTLMGEDRILLTAQTNLKQNGVWTILADPVDGEATSLKRPSDFNAAATIPKGFFVYTIDGTLKAGSGWTLQSLPGGAAIEVGTSDIVFIQTAGGGATTFGALSDTPDYDESHKKKLVVVNLNGDGLEFRFNNVIGGGTQRLFEDMPGDYPKDPDPESLYLLGTPGDGGSVNYIKVIQSMVNMVKEEEFDPASVAVVLEHEGKTKGTHGIPISSKFLHTTSVIDGGTFD